MKLIVCLLITLLLMPSIALARSSDSGGSEGVHSLDWFKNAGALQSTLENIEDILLYKWIPPLAIILVAVTGITYLFGGSNAHSVLAALTLVTVAALSLAIFLGIKALWSFG